MAKYYFHDACVYDDEKLTSFMIDQIPWRQFGNIYQNYTGKSLEFMLQDTFRHV